MKHAVRATIIAAAFCFSIAVSLPVRAQEGPTQRNFDLAGCIAYAKEHYPQFRQAQIDKQITEQNVRTGLSEWLPQVGLNAQLQHNSVDQWAHVTVGGQDYPIKLSSHNSNPYSITATQVLFDRSAILSATTAGPINRQADLNIQNQWIDLQVAVTRAFYAVLQQQSQIDVYRSDVELLARALEDIRNQYNQGVVDKTDVQRANIAFNNSRALYQNSSQMLTVAYSNLRQAMGYTEAGDLRLDANIDTLVAQMSVDTISPPDAGNRIEYSMLQIRRKLLAANLDYERLAFLPTLALFGSYNMGFANDQFHNLYSKAPNPYWIVGAGLSWPLFTGTARIHRLKAAKLGLERNELDFTTLQLDVENEYIQAVAAYKSSLENYRILTQNRTEAEKVFETIRLQYNEGIKAYIDLISAHNDMLTAQIAYFNSIFQVVVDKLYVEKALGNIN